MLEGCYRARRIERVPFVRDAHEQDPAGAQNPDKLCQRTERILAMLKEMVCHDKVLRGRPEGWTGVRRHQ